MSGNNGSDSDSHDEPVDASRSPLEAATQSVRSSEEAGVDDRGRASDEEGSESDSVSDADSQVSEEERRGDPKKVTFRYERESVPGLSHYLNKQLRSRMGSSDDTGYKLLQVCLRACLLAHRWQEANQVMELICLYPGHMDEDVMWKCGLEILYNHPDADTEMVEHFSSKLEEIFSQQRWKRMERAFYLLGRGQTKEARVTAESAQTFNESSVRKRDRQSDEHWKMVIRAYTGMLKYMQCRDAQSAHGSENQLGDTQEFTVKNACERLGTVLQVPGIWDIFITKQVELLESEDKTVEARQCLENYCQNADNPNAFRYLYKFHQRNDGQREEMIAALKEYVRRVPSDSLGLELVSLLRQSAGPEMTGYGSTVGLLTRTLFNMLDHHWWYDRLAPWKTLTHHLTRVVKGKDCVAMEVAKTCWNERDWWASYHFDKAVANRLLKKSKKVALHKTMTLMVMESTDSPFVRQVQKFFAKKEDKASLERLDKCVILARRRVKLDSRMAHSLQKAKRKEEFKKRKKKKKKKRKEKGVEEEEVEKV